MINQLKLAAASVLLTVGLSGTAQADFVDFGDYLQDNSTHLQWRDITGTVGRSWVDINSNFSQGGDFEGWRFATLADFETLIWNWTGVEPILPRGAIQEFQEGVLDNLIETLGHTYQDPETSYLSARLADGPIERPGYIYNPFIADVDGFSSPGYEYRDYIFMGEVHQLNPETSAGAALLVRSVSPVPAPAALPLALLGLAMVGAVYRRRQLAAKASV